jgi:predicted glutamine amidotransferase
MCVIIAKPSNATSFDKTDLTSAASVNPDGWGVSYVKDGKIEIYRSFNPKGNESEEIIEWFEKLKDAEAVFHLRFSTAGAKNEDNCHPFLIELSDKEQIAFHHNGTISETGSDSARSDTKWVADEILPKLLKAYVDPETGFLDINNHSLHFILTKIAGAGSKFALHSNVQGVLLINAKAGDQRHGCWVSNTYSFNASHRTKYTGVYAYSSSKDSATSSTKEVSKSAVAPFQGEGSTAAPSTPSKMKKATTPSGGSKSTGDEGSKIAPVEAFNKEAGRKMAIEVPKFNEYLLELYPTTDPDESQNFAAYVLNKVNLERMGSLGIDDLAFLCQDYPEISASLLFSLLQMAQNAYFAEFIATEEDFDEDDDGFENMRKVA